MKSGTIPDGWKSAPLGQLCGRITTGKLDANAMVTDGDYPFFTCARESYQINKYAFDCEALLVSGNGANVGYVHYYKGKFNAYQRTYVISDFSADVHFLKLFLDRNVQDRIRVEVNAGNTPYITMGTLTEMGVVLPDDAAEQGAIATALGDVDGLLDGLDRLIAKKRDLKQAAMQQLLTGQTRLPGFHGEWELKPLGAITARLPKTTRLSSDGKPEGRFPFFTNSTQPVDKYLDDKDFDQEVIIANTGGVAYFDYFNGPFAAMSDCMVLIAQINTKWLFYLLKSLEYSINNQGFTGSGIKHLDKEYFFDLSIRIPKSSEEQASIAYILTDIDSELGALEARRDKTRELKQGMMQELLTGRTRLLQPEALNA